MVILVAAACIMAAGIEPAWVQVDPTSPTGQEGRVSNQPKLDTKFQIEGPSLVLTYTVTNAGERDLYLLNRIPKTLPKWSLSADTIYVDLETNKKGVLFSKLIAPLPDGVMVNSPVVPFVTPVRSGEALTESVKVPVPVAEYRQYDLRRDKPKTQEVDYKKVRLLLGYSWRAEGTTEATQNIHGSEVIMPKFPPGVRPEFGTLDSGAIDFVVPVLEPIAEPNEGKP